LGIGNFWASFVPYFIEIVGLELGWRFSLYLAWIIWKSLVNSKRDELVFAFWKIKRRYSWGILELTLYSLRRWKKLIWG
jgi:hypothetical protein